MIKRLSIVFAGVLFFISLDLSASSYYWENGTRQGSGYYWRNGTGTGSSYYWKNGTGENSSYYWKNGTGNSFSNNSMISVCMGLIEENDAPDMCEGYR